MISLSGGEKMLKIGVTGGIGSGKTVVCHIFKVLGIPVFDADSEAKRLMTTDRGLVQAIREAFGDRAYGDDGALNRRFLAQRIFSDKDALNQLNALVHPVVIQAGEDWAERQQSPYVVKEAALLFETGSYQKSDYNILVTAPMTVRIQRIMKRDGWTEDQIRARINEQWTDEKKASMADFIISNDGAHAVIPQVLSLHHKFLSERS